MNKDEFWQIIEAVHDESDGNMDRKCELLKNRLLKLKDQDLRDFIRHFDSADAFAYTWPLWGAAYVMHGGCSDDSFSDFRATLISLGRKIYEAALADPESLANLDFEYDEDLCYEGFQYVKYDVAEEKLGDIPDRDIPFPDEPSGEEWDEENVDNLYPLLAAKYSVIDSENSATASKKPWWKFW
ncbi:DUF4240 domain-containing protein [Desulfatibacillum aliphaticivorans]|uniref:DUF4240 domain-containing protein n=1 Tax=Desulfatibacillum aliphaticivorans TaxID=218208 RepID=UPI000416EDAE|nr:DUF4240 domain-containing protein [Desulfatibacillum aliphaticivorans]